MGSSLKQLNIPEKSVMVTFCKKSQSVTATYYSLNGDLLCYNNIRELTKELQFEHTSEQRRLSIDLSKVRLKAVLFHNVNKFPSIPLVHAVHVTETHEDLQILQQKKKATRTAMLAVLQGGYTKFCCF